MPKHVDDSASRFREEDLRSPDEHVRAKALRRLCPCHGSFDLYERYYDVIKAMQKDESAVVRKVALHLEEDALQLERMEAGADRADELEEERLARLKGRRS